MTRDQALRLLELGPQASESLADTAYQQQRAALLALLESVSLKASAREQLVGRLAQLDAAMMCLRAGGEIDDEQAYTRVLDDDLTVMQQPSDPIEPDDPDATRFAWVDEVSPVSSEPTLQSFVGGSGAPSTGSSAFARWRIPVMVAAFSVFALAVLLVLRTGQQDVAGTSETEARPEPAVTTTELPDGEQAAQDARSDWQRWGDRLQDEQLRLASVLEQAQVESRAAAASIDSRTHGRSGDHPARERLNLIEAHVVDEDYLRVLERVLAKPLPAGTQKIQRSRGELEQLTSDASARLARLEALDLALTERQSVRAQLARLRASGLPRWPLEPGESELWFDGSEPVEVTRAEASTRAADAAFADADFGLAAQRYNRAAARLAKLEVTQTESSNESDARINELLELGREAIQRNRLSLPADASALYYALEIETLQPGREEAKELMSGIQQGYAALARGQLTRGRAGKALRYADMAVAMGADEAAVADIRRRAAGMLERQFKPLSPVTEIENIEMLTLPLGEFTMGARSSALEEFASNLGSLLGSLFRMDETRDYSGGDTEVPPHRVVISSPVAISRLEITVAQFRRFIDSSGYRTDAELQGYSYAWVNDVELRLDGKNWRHDYRGNPASDRDPVVHVSQRDAKAYARWLGALTGANYRLPSESEFEYAARAGTDSLLPWTGGRPPEGAGNFRGEFDTPPSGWRSAGDLRPVPGYRDGYFGPAPVGSFAANGYGVADTLGNVSEWVGDCFHNNYTDKSGAQSARRDGDCARGAVRGSAWSTDARLLRLSYRRGRPVSYSSNTLGFRVARDIATAR